MSFKDMLKDDLDIFISPEEFAEDIKIGEKIYQGILTYNSDKYKQVYEGVIVGIDIIISLKYDPELYQRYKPGKTILVNDEVCIVNNANVTEELLTFYLLKNVGG